MDIEFSKKSITDNCFIVLYWVPNNEIGFNLFKSREVARKFALDKVSEGYSVTTFTKDCELQPKRRIL